MCNVCKNNFLWRCVKYKAKYTWQIFWNTSWILAYVDSETQDLKMYELVLFSIILIHLFSWSFGSFFLFFFSRRSSITFTFDIQIDLKIKHAWKPLQKHFRTLSSIQDRGVCVNSLWLSVFNYFRKTLHLRFLARFWIRLCSP